MNKSSDKIDEDSSIESQSPSEGIQQTPAKRTRLSPFVHTSVIIDEKVTAKLVNNGNVKVSDLVLIDPKLLNKRSPILLDNNHFMIPDDSCHPLLKGHTICMVPGCKHPVIKTSNGNGGLSQHLSRKHNINITRNIAIKTKKDEMREKEGGKGCSILNKLNPVRKLTSRQRRECILDGIVNLVIDNNLPMTLCESTRFRELSRIIAGTQTSPVFSASIVREALRVKAGLAREATTWTLSTVAWRWQLTHFSTLSDFC